MFFLNNILHFTYLFFYICVMINKNKSTVNRYYAHNFNFGFKALCVTFLSILNINKIYEFLKSKNSIKLPIIFANIRV